LLQPGENVEERRFASARCAAEKDHFAFGYVEIDSLENLEFRLSQIVGLAKPSGPKVWRKSHAVMRVQKG
jgi:hypothetical protein